MHQRQFHLLYFSLELGVVQIVDIYIQTAELAFVLVIDWDGANALPTIYVSLD
tara:strand:+ start:1036 stop:1194 length:159 start_codon:yes stop_codon:yes gene_type:complete